MSRPSLPVSSTASEPSRGPRPGLRPWTGALRAVLALLPLSALPPVAGAAIERPDDGIRLELKPRICTLGIKDQQCEARVEASWHSDQEESLCLVIRDRPEVKKCWEHYSAGIFTIALVFRDDVTFELRDPGLQEVLASEVLRIIKETLRYRHKRKQPWNVFD